MSFSFIEFVNFGKNQYENIIMEEGIIKNDKQIYFNQVKGIIDEINLGDDFCNLTLKVGHDNNRMCNFVMKTPHFEKFKDIISVNQKVSIRFYINSRKKFDRWYTTANVLDIHKEY
jgi:hypothetical protein